jgi:GTPase SAR1 family protein
MSILDLKGISFKVILIGDSSKFFLFILGVGKTTLIHKYIHGDFLFDYHITVGVDFSSKTVQLEDSRFVQLQIWDTVFYF